MFIAHQRQHMGGTGRMLCQCPDGTSGFVAKAEICAHYNMVCGQILHQNFVYESFWCHVGNIFIKCVNHHAVGAIFVQFCNFFLRGGQAGERFIRLKILPGMGLERDDDQRQIQRICPDAGRL